MGKDETATGGTMGGTIGKRAPASTERLIAMGRAVIEIEARAVAALAGRVDEGFATACRIMLACQGRIVCLGVGKSGHIGGKIAATLASTGTPAFFVHSGEASHGDMGMITATDVVLALSNSGATDELLILIPFLKRLGVPLIALTGNPASGLAQAATVNLHVGVTEEACPLGLAPTASTTAALAMGDALAIALLEARGFGMEDFARAHPGGSLGRRLLLRVQDIVHTGAEIPAVGPDLPLAEALVEMSRKGLGVAVVVGPGEELLGIFTDGDLRRALDLGADPRTALMRQVMTAHCKTIAATALAAEAARLMETHKINALPVVEAGRVVGVINMHDLLRARIL
jgi:arabinose-5-phosphate isomerase